MVVDSCADLRIQIAHLSVACCLRAVNTIKSVFHGLACHLSPCMLLKLRFFADSIPSALTSFSITYPLIVNLKFSGVP